MKKNKTKTQYIRPSFLAVRYNLSERRVTWLGQDKLNAQLTLRLEH
jgi:hypothetical protein